MQPRESLRHAVTTPSLTIIAGRSAMWSTMALIVRADAEQSNLQSLPQHASTPVWCSGGPHIELLL
jgi:hypothetical protein